MRPFALIVRLRGEQHSESAEVVVPVEISEIAAADTRIALVYEGQAGAQRHVLFAETRFWEAVRRVPEEAILRYSDLSIRLLLERVSSSFANSPNGLPIYDIAAHAPYARAVEILTNAIAKNVRVIGDNLYVACDEPVATLWICRGEYLDVTVSLRDGNRTAESAFEAPDRTSFSLASIDTLAEFRQRLSRRRVTPPMRMLQAPNPDLFSDDDGTRFSVGTRKWLMEAIRGPGVALTSPGFIRAYRDFCRPDGGTIVHLAALCEQVDTEPVSPVRRWRSGYAAYNSDPRTEAARLLSLAAERIAFQFPDARPFPEALADLVL